MNILLINHYAGSPKHGMEYRPYYLAREWVRQGHRVTVVGASCSHVRMRKPELTGSVSEERIDGIRYVWLKTPDYRGNGVRRVVNILAFVAALARHRARVVGRDVPDAVIASSTYPLDIFPAHAVAKRSGAKLIFEVHDLWPLTPIEVGGMSPRHPFIMLLQAAENYAYRRADSVVSLLPKADTHMRQHGMAAEKFVHIPNGVDLDEWQTLNEPLPEEHQRTIDGLRADGRFLVGYAGAHGAANALDVLLGAAARLRPLPVNLLLVGQGPEKEPLARLARERELKNVHLLPPVPKLSVPAFLRSMDALYIGLARQPLFRFGVSPNKLFDYMMAARPVVYAIDSGSDLVAESGCGISCGAEDPDAVADAISRLSRMPSEERRTMGANGHRHVVRHHRYSQLAERFLACLDQTQGKGVYHAGRAA